MLVGNGCLGLVLGNFFIVSLVFETRRQVEYEGEGCISLWHRGGFKTVILGLSLQIQETLLVHCCSVDDADGPGDGTFLILGHKVETVKLRQKEAGRRKCQR